MNKQNIYIEMIDEDNDILLYVGGTTPAGYTPGENAGPPPIHTHPLLTVKFQKSW